MLIIGSGNIVHNLREMAWEDTAYDWALEFDAQMKELILSGDHKAIIDYSKLGRSARLAVPTLEHYLPLLYVLGAQDEAGPRELLRREGDAGVDVDALGEARLIQGGSGPFIKIHSVSGRTGSPVWAVRSSDRRYAPAGWRVRADSCFEIKLANLGAGSIQTAL